MEQGFDGVITDINHHLKTNGSNGLIKDNQRGFVKVKWCPTDDLMFRGGNKK